MTQLTNAKEDCTDIIDIKSIAFQEACKGSKNCDTSLAQEKISEEDVQRLLKKPLSSRSKDLISRSFILGVVRADSTRDKKRKRLSRQETGRESASSIPITQFAQGEVLTEIGNVLEEHPELEDFQENGIVKGKMN